MFKYTNKWEDQKIDSVDTWYEIDQVKMAKWLKHLRDLNYQLMNDLSRDDVQRGIDKGRFNAYDCLLGNIRGGTIFMRNEKEQIEPVSSTASSAFSDTKMLDWLDKQGAHYGWGVQLPADYPNVRDCVFVCRNTTSGHKTIREAIAHRMGKPAPKSSQKRDC